MGIGRLTVRETINLGSVVSEAGMVSNYMSTVGELTVIYSIFPMEQVGFLWRLAF